MDRTSRQIAFYVSEMSRIGPVAIISLVAGFGERNTRRAMRCGAFRMDGPLALPR